MADFNFAHFAADFENKKRFSHVATIFKNQRVPGNADQRLFPSQEGTPLNELEKIVAPVQEVQEEFDFELGEVLTYEDAVRLCEEAEVNVSDMIVGKCGRTFFNRNLGQGPRREVEISKGENADHNVELSRCRFLDNARTIIDWKSSLPGLKTLARERKYTAFMVENCLRKLISEYCKVHIHMVDEMNANQIATYLLSTEVNMDKTVHRKKELNQLVRSPEQELRIPLTMARMLIDKIYPEDVAANAAARSATWRTAMISFSPDVVAMPLLEMIRKRMEDCDPMSDEDIHQMALSADETIKRPLPGPLKYGRQVGASPVINQIHFNSVNTGFQPYGMPLEGYGNPYQAYPAFPQSRDDYVALAARQQVPAVHQVAPVVQQLNPAITPAQLQAELQAAVRVEMARQQAAAQQQLQAIRHDLVTPERSLEVMGAPTGSASGNTTNTLPRPGLESGALRSNNDQGHDPMMASASGSVDQGQGSTEAASGARPKTRSQTAAAKPALEVDSIHLLAVTLAEALKANQPRGQSRDQSYKRGQVSDGRYTSRERSTGGTSVRSDSRDGGRERSQSRGRDLAASRNSNRDSTDSAGRYQSFRRAESKSPRRSSGTQSRTSEDRAGRSASRGRSKDSSRPNSGFLRQNYPEMVQGTNCRIGYNPVKEKHCTKCYPAADHHEFLCKKYALYSYGSCTQCGRGHHFHVECKDKVETFPPSVGESHPGGLAKN